MYRWINNLCELQFVFSELWTFGLVSCGVAYIVQDNIAKQKTLYGEKDLLSSVKLPFQHFH